MGLLSPINKKGDEQRAVSYNPLCMLSHKIKIIEGAIGNSRLRETKVCARQFGFQRGNSALMTLMDVDTFIRQWLHKIVTRDLTKVYDRANRTRCIRDCKKRMGTQMMTMIRAFLQPLTISKKDTHYAQRLRSDYD